MKKPAKNPSKALFSLPSSLFLSIALAAPIGYVVIKDGAPDNFEKLVRDAFAKWQAVPSTTLKVDAPKSGASVQFRWGAEIEPEMNPDLATRTILETGADGKVTTTVQVNPDTADLEGALLLETGLRLGLALEPSWEGTRSLTDADKTLLRQTYAPNGDLTADGKVNIDDFELFAAEYGKSQATGGIKGDFNGDGRVDSTDFEILKGNYEFGGSVGEEPKPVTPAPTDPKPADPKPTTPPEPKPATPEPPKG
jgi:Dockerin type I domain